MDNIKTNQNEFTKAFLDDIRANAAEFESRDIDISRIDEDIGYFNEDWRGYMDKVDGPDLFLDKFFDKNGRLIADMLANSSYYKSMHPWTLSLSYKDIEVSRATIGKEMYRYGVGETFSRYVGSMVNSFIVNQKTLGAFMDGNKEARSVLMSFVDFQMRYNWNICWAYTDWIKECFPEVYNKMVADGEFLSVEEMRGKMDNREGAAQ